MEPVITVFKSELLGLFELYDQLGILPDEVTPCEYFYTYSPPPGKLDEVLDLLKRNKINHAIRFETPVSARSKRARKNLTMEAARA
jgi:hypothetical protein